MEVDDFDSGGDHSAPEDCGAEEDMLLGCETDSPRTQLIKANIRQVGAGRNGQRRRQGGGHASGRELWRHRRWRHRPATSVPAR